MMRDFSRGLEHLSINTATLRKQLALPAIIEACAAARHRRHLIRGATRCTPPASPPSPGS